MGVDPHHDLGLAAAGIGLLGLGGLWILGALYFLALMACAIRTAVSVKSTGRGGKLDGKGCGDRP